MTIELGIFAKTFPRPSYKETLAAVANSGFSHVHWNMSCAGLPSMPDRIESDLPGQIAEYANALGLRVAALSGTFNMIDPDPSKRSQGFIRLRVLASACADLGTSLITVCTGTRDPNDMWRRHPGNDTESAWTDLRESITLAVKIAEEFDLTIGIEPEFGNVVNSADRARRLLDEIDSPRLGIVLDPANLIEGIAPSAVGTTIDHAFALLGDRIVSAHAKDRDAAGQVQPAGKGIVPWATFIPALLATGYTGPLILHGLGETEIVDARVKLTSIASA